MRLQREVFIDLHVVEPQALDAHMIVFGARCRRTLYEALCVARVD